MEQRQIPGQWPSGRFDLIVFSEILYYFGDGDLDQVLNHGVRALPTGRDPARGALAAPGGRLSPGPVTTCTKCSQACPGLRHLVRHTQSPTSSPRSTSRRRYAGIGRPGDGPGVNGRLGAIAAVGVVVPAHNEETLLPACLAALRRTASALHVPVHVLVVADMCSDRTAAVAQAGGARVISIQARRVGAARAAGMRELLRLTSGSDPSGVWLATTDADTVVRRDGCGASSNTRMRAGMSSSVPSP